MASSPSPSETARQRRRRLPHLLAVVSLAPGAVHAFGVPDLTLAVLTTLVVLANLVALRSAAPSRSSLLLIHLLNAALCGYLAYRLAQQGSQELPYVWGLAAILFGGVFVLQLFRPSPASTPGDAA